MSIEIFTDGACSGNPGPGGWGYVFVNFEKKKVFEGGGPQNATTNNRMEMTAVIRALEQLKRPCKVKIYTDSVYVQKGMTEWIAGWKARGWRTADKKPVKNDDLWKQLDSLTSQHDIKWVWVKGHAGHAQNEYANHLATTAAAEQSNSQGLVESGYGVW